MVRLRLAGTLLVAVALADCGTGLQRSEPPKAIIEEKRDRQEDAIPKFRYRTGRGLTVTGDT